MVVGCFMLGLVCGAGECSGSGAVVLWWSSDGLLWPPLQCKMVATRGNTGNENERKSSLPSRESRRTTKGAMQEPEDEVHILSLSCQQGGRAAGRWERRFLLWLFILDVSLWSPGSSEGFWRGWLGKRKPGTPLGKGALCHCPADPKLVGRYFHYNDSSSTVNFAVLNLCHYPF